MSTSRPSVTMRQCPRRRQGGMVTLIVMLFLVGTIVFMMAKALETSTASTIDSLHQEDGHAAFFLAESGLEAGQKILRAAPALTEGVCSGTLSPTNSLGRGNYALRGEWAATPCGGTGQPQCGCKLISTGTVGSASRELTYSETLGPGQNGTSCSTATAVPDCTNASTVTWKLNLVNNQSAPAIGVFSLATKRGGANTGATCTNPSCRLQWNINSQNGANSVGSMGNAVPIGVGGSFEIYQTLSDNFNLAQVGALFVGTGSGPELTGPSTVVSGQRVYPPGGAAYWAETNNGNPSSTNGSTVAKATGFVGYINDGTTTDSTVNTTVTTPATGTAQGRTNWCYGGDTLVFGVAADASALSDQLNTVVFGTDTTGTNANQRVEMTKVAKFPTALIAGAPTNVFAEIWYARNADYLSNATATTGGVFTGNSGASFTATFTNGSPTMNVTAVSSGTLRVNDRVQCTGTCPAFLSGTVTISSLGTGTGGLGTYNLSANCSDPNCTAGRTMRGLSNTLTISATTSGALSVDDTITGTGIAANTTITSLGTGTGGNGSYVMSSQQNIASTTITANGPTVRVTGGTVPTGGIPPSGARVAVRTGTGELAPGTIVLGPATTPVGPTPTSTQFRLNAAPTTRLVNATLCGGTCAFFRKGSGTPLTEFTITKTAGTGYWGGGFLCLKGVTEDPLIVNSQQIQSRRWQEIPQ